LRSVESGQYRARMGWVKGQTTEMPALLLPNARQRRRRRMIGVLLSLLVFGVVATTAIYSSSLLHWLRLDPPPAGAPLAIPTNSAVDEPGALVDPTQSGSPEPSASASPTPSGTVTPIPTALATSPAAPTTRATIAPTATPMPDLENDVLNQTNAARVANKCAPLKMDPHLLTAARLHSADMAENNYFDHVGLDGTGPDARMKAAGYDISAGWAENIADGYPTADAVMTAWLNSPGHRGNILNCGLRSIGIGIARAANGSLYWTQDFGGH
jgi:uncharacterized protein YkwD